MSITQMSPVAGYLRVSTSSQDTDMQRGDVERYLAVNAPNAPIFEDKVSGRTMKRPAFDRLMELVRAGHIREIVVWRLDRLGRTNSGLAHFFSEMVERKVNIVSLREGVNLETPAGRMLVGVLSSLAAFEVEIIGERVRAGIASARRKGYRPQGGKPGRTCDPRKAARISQAISMYEAALIRGEVPNVKEIGKVVGVGGSAVRNYLMEYRKEIGARSVAQHVAEIEEAERAEVDHLSMDEMRPEAETVPAQEGEEA